MKIIAMLVGLALCTALMGCDTQTEGEKIQEQNVQNIKDVQSAWEATQEASYERVDQLEEEMSYKRVVEILGSTGKQKMNAQMGAIQRTVFEWALEGDVFVKATFDDGFLKKWESN